MIERSLIDWYLNHVGYSDLPNWFEEIDDLPVTDKAKFHEIQNKPTTDEEQKAWVDAFRNDPW